MIKVEIAYVDKDHKTFLKCLSLEKDISAREAILKSNVLDEFPELTLETLSIGLFSQKINLDDTLTENTRLEIYRELTLPPMERRRLVAKRRKKK